MGGQGCRDEEETFYDVALCVILGKLGKKPLPLWVVQAQHSDPSTSCLVFWSVQKFTHINMNDSCYEIKYLMGASPLTHTVTVEGTPCLLHL